MLITLAAWKWKKKVITTEERTKRRNLAHIFALKLINDDFDLSKFINHDTVLITGDGHTLPDDVKLFESFNIPHDLYCVNRSLMYFQRPAQHWGAVDAEESIWFSKYCTQSSGICRHTFGEMKVAFDAHWMVDNFEYQNDMQKHLWVGNTGYFGILTAIAMGYKKIVLAGMPMDGAGHWYEHPEDVPAPQWVDRCYTQWMDFAVLPQAQKVKSLSGYSKFILGEANREWLIT